MQYQLFLAVTLAIVGCAVAESKYEKALGAAIGEINRWTVRSMNNLMWSMSKYQVTPESGEASITKGLVDYLFLGSLGGQYTSIKRSNAKEAKRQPSNAYEMVFASELVGPCEKVIEQIAGPAKAMEKNRVTTNQSSSDTWMSIYKYCQKFLGDRHHWSDVVLKMAKDKNLL